MGMNTWKNTERGMLRKTGAYTFDLGDDLEITGMKPKITLTRTERTLNARSGTTFLMTKSIRSNKSGAIVTNRSLRRSLRSTTKGPEVECRPGRTPAMHQERSTTESAI
jgi:hypothetical protein